MRGSSSRESTRPYGAGRGGGIRSNGRIQMEGSGYRTETQTGGGVVVVTNRQSKKQTGVGSRGGGGEVIKVTAWLGVTLAPKQRRGWRDASQ
jgi:hypothetical protein